MPDKSTRPASTDATLTHLRAEDYETTADLLSLVMSAPPTAADLREFTVREFVDSDNWAAMTHLAASDNNVPVPERPDVLAKFERGAADSPCPVRSLIGETKVIAEERRTRPMRGAADS